jgi:hypothetical protein
MELNESTSTNSSADAQSSNGAGEFSGSAADYSAGTSVPASGIRGKLDTARTKVADGAHAATDWIKQADIEGIKSGIEQQVRSNPVRSLLVAVGVGYLVGRAMRGNGS